MKPYSFIPMLKTSYHNAYNHSNLSGKIELTIEVLNSIYISKGEYDMTESDVIYNQFFRVGDQYAIPGTSIKGMIRSLAEMVSYSCISIDKRFQGNVPDRKKKSCKASRDGNNFCITCDIFGAMGKASKVKISNFIYENESGSVSIEGLPNLKGPHPEKAHIYMDENKMFKGYKIYNHGISSILKKGNYQCECLNEGAKFKGNVIYENLDSEELQLLCFSLGLTNDFNHKIGYGKPAYYGTIKVTSKDQEYTKYANEYKNNCSKDIKNNIMLLEEKYSFKNANKIADYDVIY